MQNAQLAVKYAIIYKTCLILPAINATYIYKLYICISISTLKLKCVHMLAGNICATLTHLRTWTN